MNQLQLWALFQLVKVFKPRQHDLFARLFDLAGEEHLVQNGIHLVEVENQVQFAHVSKKGIQHLDEEVDGFKVGQLVVVGVDARAEEEAGISPVDDF
jgi:hypothetical protein